MEEISKTIKKNERKYGSLLSERTREQSHDYHEFGMEMNGRGFHGDYRFGYQGSEKDNEVSGEGNSYTTEFRQLDPRLGRWFSVDPWAQKYPYISPYASMFNNPICLNDPKGLGDNEGEEVKVANDQQAHKDAAGNTVVFGPGAKALRMVTASGMFTLRNGEQVYLEEGTVVGYWDKDDNFHSGVWELNKGSGNWNFVGYSSGKAKKGPSPALKSSYFVGGIPDNFKGESTKVACGNVERESVMGDDFKGNPLNLDNEVVESSILPFDPTKDDANAILNTGQALMGGGELLIQTIRHADNGPRDLSRALKSTGFFRSGTTKVAESLERAGEKLKVVGKKLGAIGFAFSAASYIYDLSSGRKLTTGQHVAFYTGAIVTGVAAAFSAPVVAAGALLYGVGELISYFGTGKTIEERLID